MAESARALDWVGYVFLLLGGGALAAGALLSKASAQQAVSVFPVGLVVAGILAGSFGGFWLLATKRQRPGYARIVTGPRRPDPPSQ